MKIAAITVCMNDGFKTNEWLEHYQGYKRHIYKNIIVDNGSSQEYLNYVKELFTDSVIIERHVNGGTTAAYNDGIMLAMQDPEVDSILLIANDIKLSEDALLNLHKKLFEVENVGMIAPIMFLKNSFEIIESFGSNISNISLKTQNSREKISDLLPLNKFVDIVPGGMHLSKRNLYESVGLQDDSLFMYSDEIDMAIRIRKNGFKVLVTREIQCWHQHINSVGGSREGFAYFLQARNKLLLGYKHYSIFRVIYTFFSLNCLRFPYVFRRAFIERRPKLIVYYLLGSIFGLFNIKKNFNYIISNKI
jgi:GT2 family glycosyltransferase